MKTIILYGLVILFFVAGIFHFITPNFYKGVMPSVFPNKPFFIMMSGIVEILLAIFLIFEKTRARAALFTFVLLVLFLITVHGIKTMELYQDYDKSATQFWLNLIRIPIQFLLLYACLIFINQPKLDETN